jgi:hypothetical protein
MISRPFLGAVAVGLVAVCAALAPGAERAARGFDLDADRPGKRVSPGSISEV